MAAASQNTPMDLDTLLSTPLDDIIKQERQNRSSNRGKRGGRGGRGAGRGGNVTARANSARFPARPQQGGRGGMNGQNRGGRGGFRGFRGAGGRPLAQNVAVVRRTPNQQQQPQLQRGGFNQLGGGSPGPRNQSQNWQARRASAEEGGRRVNRTGTIQKKRMPVTVMPSRYPVQRVANVQQNVPKAQAGKGPQRAFRTPVARRAGNATSRINTSMSRQAGGGISNYDRQVMKKIKIVAQLDKVPPPLLQQRDRNAKVVLPSSLANQPHPQAGRGGHGMTLHERFASMNKGGPW